MKLLDLFCGAGGSAMGYYRAGFTDIVGVDNRPQPHYPFTFVQADALEYLAEHGHEFDAIHASPPCQGYSIMHNLPWLRGREYPLLILPTLERLEGLGRPYILENVMGARHGAKGLAKRGLEAHGLKAGYLCGAMFGLPFYRHRLFATNWLWLAPGHPRHQGIIKKGPLFGNNGGRLAKVVYSDAEDKRGMQSWPGRREEGGHGLTVVGSLAAGLDTNPNPVNTAWRQYHDGGLSRWQGYGSTENGARKLAAGIGHAKGWRLAAEAMGIDWMTRAELTQAIPPMYTAHIGEKLLSNLESVLAVRRSP